ncbi:Ig-like domain-containing protein [Massilia sp. B-10]|nr:Ig-like domain-containing protein [Massilia sp. B-10]
MTVSAPLTVTVKANVPPSVALTKPLGNVSYAAPGMVALAVNAADSDGTLTKVAYFQGGTQIAMSTVAPFAASWSNVAIGDYSITAKAYDDKGGITTSAAVPISVKANVLLSCIGQHVGHQCQFGCAGRSGAAGGGGIGQ